MRLEVVQQLRLRFAVMGRVVVVVEVVLRNVRDDGRVELRAGGPVLIEGVAGNFQGGVRRLAGHHRRQPRGQRAANRASSFPTVPSRRRCGIRLCPSRPVRSPVVSKIERMSQVTVVLPLVPVTATRFRCRDGCAGQSRAQLGIRASHVGNDALRNLHARQRTLDEQAVGTVLDRFLDEGGPVHVRAGDGGKQSLRCTLLARLDGIRDADVGTAHEAGCRQERAKADGDPQGRPLGHAEDLPDESAVVQARSTVSEWRRAHRDGRTKQFSAGFWKRYVRRKNN